MNPFKHVNYPAVIQDVNVNDEKEIDSDVRFNLIGLDVEDDISTDFQYYTPSPKAD